MKQPHQLLGLKVQQLEMKQPLQLLGMKVQQLEIKQQEGLSRRQLSQWD
jgi:hypothetical protein